MSTPLAADTIGLVTPEDPWRRLHRIADARRKHLHLTVDGIKGAGGPSASWFHNLKNMSGPLSNRHVPHLNALDDALQWPMGTSIRLLEQDRTGWSAEVLADEELQLIEGQDEISHLAFMVDRKLRMVGGDVREQMMREVGRAIGLPLGD